VETEKEMLFTLPNGQSFKGIIDRLDHLADGSLIINDYKTGKKLPTEKDIAYKNQLSLYAYALKQQYGAERTIKARLYYLHFNIEEVREIQSEYLNTLIQEYQTHTSEIEEKRQNYFQTKTPLPTQESTLCSYCEYQSSCPLRKRKYLDQLSISEQQIQPIIDTYAQISQNITKHKQQSEQNKKLILEYMEQQQCSHLEREQISLSIRTTNILSIPDKEQLETFLHKQHLRGQATSVTRYTIAALLKEKHIAEQAFA
jgi:CRISPR/Cas system-associated exonuclease Cas4 (RecB family)